MRYDDSNYYCNDVYICVMMIVMIRICVMTHVRIMREEREILMQDSSCVGISVYVFLCRFFRQKERKGCC